MPRSRSGTISRSPVRNTATAYKQAPIKASPSQSIQSHEQSGGFMRQMGSVMAQGMAFGAGSEIAHQAIRGVMGGNDHKQQIIEQDTSLKSKQSYNKCEFENTQFISCLKGNSDNINLCQSYFDLLKSCEKTL